MNMTLAIERLFGCWMRDISATAQYPGGMVQGRLHLLETLVHQLEASPPEKWFEALPARGEARAYYQDIVLPLQQALELEDLSTLGHLKAHISKLPRRWITDPWEELRQGEMSARSFATWEKTLFEMELALLRGAGPGYVSSRLGGDHALYFAFVEDVEIVPAGQRAYAASGLPIGTPLNGAELEHVRFSAILMDRFLPLIAQIDPVDPDNVRPEQRIKRKEQLQEVLDGIALPILELFLNPDAKDALGIEPVFGDWCLLGHASLPDDEGLSIYITDPDNSERPTTTRAALSLLAQASEFWQNSLRDIFSLVHIPDADFDETERGDGNPLPNPPTTPHIQEAEQLKGEEEQQAESPAVYRSAG